MLSSSEKFVAKIEENKISPKPRWQFSVKKYSVLTFTVVLLILGSLAFSLVLYLVNNQDWGLQSISRGRWLVLIITTLPYAWLLFFALFIISIFYSLRQLKHGYKYPTKTIVLSSLVTVVFFGSLAAGFGIHRRIHLLLSQQVPYYQTAFDSQARIWARPQMGFLAGKVTEFDSDNLIIQDPGLNDWQIAIGPKTVIDSDVDLELNEQVKVMGHITKDKIFEAQEIKLWEKNIRPRKHRSISSPRININQKNP